MNDAPQLLVNWSSPWQEFLAAVGPALRHSPPKLRFETRAGLFPVRGMVLSLLLEVAALATTIAHPARFVEQPLAPPAPQTHEVIYFSADELPRTEDLGGTAAGTHGSRGGASLRHPSQIIRVARGESLREKVTDAPHLNLPRSDAQISNLLAYKADPLPAPPPPPAISHPVVPPPPSIEAPQLKRPRPDLNVAVVPPPPDVQQSQSRLEIARSFANPVVAPPPVALPVGQAVMRSPLPAIAVAPPPVAAPAQVTSHTAQLLLPAATVVPPAPDMKAAIQSHRVLADPVPRVVPPPVELSDSQRQMRSLGNATAAPPVPDPPQARPQASRFHDFGTTNVQPPPATSGTAVASANAGVIVSAKPGNQPAVPALPEKGMVGMSPRESATAVVGGEDGGRGLARGIGPGASPSGAASGAGTSGTGKGTVDIARNTNSPYPGPGGAGTMKSGNPRVPGVSVSGGMNVITLPSFGAAPDPGTMTRSAAPKGLGNGITVVASSRSGGALNLYGALKGDRVYTIYINTQAGTAVMQFADPSSASRPSVDQLIAPRALRAEVPAGWSSGHRPKLLIACELDRDGMLQNARVLQSDDSSLAQQMLAALTNWKFAPAFRGNEPVEVNAILGFGVDTN